MILKPLRIGVDLDEVVRPLVPELILWHNEIYQTSLKIQDFQTYKFWVAWGGTEEEAIYKFLDYVNSEWHENVLPFPDVLDVLKAKKEMGSEIYLVTSRQNDIIRPTVSWIEKHFINIFDDLIFTNNYGLSGKHKPKSEVCNELALDVLIDDSVDYLNLLKESHTLPVLFGQYPWNFHGRNDFVNHANWLSLVGDPNIFPR